MREDYELLDGQTDIYDFADMFGIKQEEVIVHENTDIPVPVKVEDFLKRRNCL